MPKGKPSHKSKVCPTCNTTFVATNNFHKYCSPSCRIPTNSDSTEWQYKRVSGNWRRYFNRLCARSFKREGLTVDMMVNLLEAQNGRCALSGVTLTCTLQKGVINRTNASIDRIDPKGAYTLDNVQLVCAVLNNFRVDTPLNEFIDWCRKVAEYAVHKESKTLSS
jgi:hypothetical protein